MWLLIFFVTPIIEMYLLIEVGGYIGALPTIGLVMLTAVIGVALLRVQGLTTLTRGMSRLQGGELPALEVVEGLLLAAAGALLLTPGFITDGIGFTLLVPQSRQLIAGRILLRVGDRINVVSPAAGASHRPGAGMTGLNDAIEGEYEPLGPDSSPTTPEKPPPGH